MKKHLLTLATGLLLCFSANGQGTMTLTTSAEPGTEIKILPNALTATSPISIDYGDGEVVKYTVDPNRAAYERWITGTVKGGTITISGNLTEFELSDAKLTTAKINGMVYLNSLDLSDNEITEFELQSTMPIKTLRLSNNKIWNSPSVNANLTLDMVGETLKNLYVDKNEGLQCLDIRSLQVLEELYAYQCPDLGSVFICTPEETRENLKYINLGSCSLAHFYPVNLPGLSSLDLSDNLLMSENDDEPFAMGNYPNLRSLTISNNKGIKGIDVSNCPYLESLYIDGCNFSNIDITSNPELISLNIANNKISSIDLGNNRNLSVVLINDNPITEFNMDYIPNVSSLNISNTLISRIDLMKAAFLKSFKAANTKLEFVDFNGQQAERMTLIDLRNNPNFTYESMAYTVRTLPVARKSYSSDPNLLLTGSNAEKADIETATNSDWQWKCDVTGDGSAEWSPLSITYGGATKTGEKKTGHLDRLYPYAGMGLDYDLEVMSTEGGKFVVAQWEPVYFQSIKDATDGTVLKGVPIRIYAYPDEGKRFESITVNDKEIDSPWFIVSENADVKVNFADELSSIAMTVAPGQEMSFLVNTTKNNGTIWIDWGAGSQSEYTGQRGYTTAGTEIAGTRIDGKAAGSTVTLYGDIAALDISGYGDVAADFGLWDNHVTAIDVTKAPGLKFLNTYWNPIKSIDLSNNTLLEVLDISYTAITELDLSKNTNLMSLEAYASRNEEEGIKQLKSVDITGLSILQNLNLKNNGMSSIDITKNPYLRWVNLCGNNFTSIDLSNNTIIDDLNLSSNKLTSVDLSKLTAMTELDLSGNELTTVDVSNNKELRILMIANNYLKTLDTKALSHLQRLYINGNGMTAEQINDIYYNLPVRVDEGGDNSMSTTWNLCVYQANDRTANDYSGNDSSIATDRGWTPSHLGSNAGCDVAYLDIISATNGTFTVTDASGKVYVHGSKVPKWIPLTINAKPNAGYGLGSYQLNDDAPVAGSNTFEMPGIYTKLRVNFVKDAGVSTTAISEPVVRAVTNGVEITTETPATAAVFTMAGACVSEGEVNGTIVIDLAAGFYIVKVGTVVKTVSVK